VHRNGRCSATRQPASPARFLPPSRGPKIN
jgi:hypothetical protein